MLSRMAPVLVERTVWTKPRPEAPRYTPDLTPDEIANVKRALRVLKIRYGTWPKVAEAMKVKPSALADVVNTKGKPSVGVALRAARLAGVPLEDVLSGAWPKAGSCPMCGRL
jgi:hypothetical protein